MDRSKYTLATGTPERQVECKRCHRTFTLLPGDWVVCQACGDAPTSCTPPSPAPEAPGDPGAPTDQA
jgi:hypothetical protein